MHQFIAKYRDQIQGVTAGFDRVVFRGSLRRICFQRGMEKYLWQNKVLFKDYQQHVKKISERLKEASVAPFRQKKLPVVYLRRSDADKEQIARAIAAEHRISVGPVCALSCLEPSPTFEHYGTHMVARVRPCLVLYHYSIDPEWGWMNARSNLVSVLHPGLPERAGMAGAADGPGGLALLPPGQLLSLAEKLRASATTAGPATEDELD